MNQIAAHLLEDLFASNQPENLSTHVNKTKVIPSLCI